jgi:hypothetical protein
MRGEEVAMSVGIVSRSLFTLLLLLSTPVLLSTDVGAAARPQSAQEILRAAAASMDRAGSLHYELRMEFIVNPIFGQPWTSRSTMVGNYQAPDRLSGDLTIANPWSETRSQIIVAGGQAYASNPQTGAWETELKRATTYYPVILTGCLIRMGEADVRGLALVGTGTLDGVPVYHLAGMGGAAGDMQLDYWIGVADKLPRKARVASGDRPGWSDEANTFRFTATLNLSGFGAPVTISAPVVGS